MDREPNTKPFTSEACFFERTPISVITAKKTTIIKRVIRGVEAIFRSFFLSHFTGRSRPGIKEAVQGFFAPLSFPACKVSHQIASQITPACAAA